MIGLFFGVGPTDPPSTFPYQGTVGITQNLFGWDITVEVGF